MPAYYFDIETTGINAKLDKIITIQFQELERLTGQAKGPLVVLKEWESSEREIIQEFIEKSGILDENDWSFVPVGYNLNFEHRFLKERTAVHSFTPLDILNKPFVDLRAIGILANRGEFKNSGLDKITGKKSSGKNVPTWYHGREFNKIIEYVEDEAKCFLELYSWLLGKSPEFIAQFKKENGIC